MSAPAAGDRLRRRRRIPGWVGGAVTAAAILAVLLGLCWLAWAAYLFLLADEGPVPPRWRAPDLPAGASVVGESRDCASGGCRRTLLLQPGAGRTPEQLATDLGLVDDQHLGRHLLDPHPVTVGSAVVGRRLEVSLQYDAAP